VSRFFHIGHGLTPCNQWDEKEIDKSGCQRYKEHYLVTERSFTKARSVRALHRKRMNEEFIQLFIAFYPVILKKVAFYGKKLNTIEKHSYPDNTKIQKEGVSWKTNRF
jgi:hypothetical protein